MWRDAEHTLDQHELPVMLHLMLLGTQDHVEPSDQVMLKILSLKALVFQQL
jgi:hypothetical protein